VFNLDVFLRELKLLEKIKFNIVLTALILMLSIAFKSDFNNIFILYRFISLNKSLIGIKTILVKSLLNNLSFLKNVD